MSWAKKPEAPVPAQQASDTERVPEVVYQPVSSSGLEHPMDDSLVSFGQEPSYQEIPPEDDLSHLFDDEEDAAETLRVPSSFAEEPLPPTQPSSDIASGIRLASGASEEALSMKPASEVSPLETAYEMTVRGTIKTEGDRQMPPYTSSSLRPDAEKPKDGRDAA